VTKFSCDFVQTSLKDGPLELISGKFITLKKVGNKSINRSWAKKKYYRNDNALLSDMEKPWFQFPETNKSSSNLKRIMVNSPHHRHFEKICCHSKLKMWIAEAEESLLIRLDMQSCCSYH